MLKRLFRGVMRRARMWLHEEVPRRFSPIPDTAYEYLNDVFERFLKNDGLPLRPHFVWGVLQGAHLARALGIRRISVMEFGVAGGNGLINLERVAELVQDELASRSTFMGLIAG